MKLCPTCGRPANKRYRGYCSKVHHRLATRKPKKLLIPCASCGSIQKRNPSQVVASGNVFCKFCKKSRGELHYRYRDGQYINPDGYRFILVNGSYQREHRVVWERVNKACLLPGATIHHISMQKLDNTPDNLLLLSSEEHGRFHRLVETEKKTAAVEILLKAAKRQFYYPKGVDEFIEALFSNSDTTT